MASSSVPRALFVRLVAGGDANLGRACGQRLLAEPEYDPFHGVASLWADADVRFVNLESPLSEQHGETQSPHHNLVFTGPPGGAEALARAGIGLVSTANNHAWDYTKRGLFETLANLDRAGIAHAGTAEAEADAYRPVLVHVNGLTLALFAVTQVWNLGVFSEEEARHHVAWADMARLRDSLTEARASADFVIVSYHGGEEYIDAPLASSRAFVSEVIGAGADVVIGHHPHVPQGVAFIGGHPAFFSLGNLVFDGRSELPWTRASFLAKLKLERGAPIAVSACPYAIEGYEPIALLPADPRAVAVLGHLRDVSTATGGVSIGEPDALGCVTLAPLAVQAASPDSRSSSN